MEINTGDCVKILRSGESFWVLVTVVAADRIYGRVDNDLIKTREHGLKVNDLIGFDSDEILNHESK